MCLTNYDRSEASLAKPCVLLADGHRIVLEGLRNILQPEFEIVAAVEDGRTLVTEAKRLQPDLAVADISMPGLNGIDGARQIKKIDERIRMVFLTMHADAGYASSAFAAGASSGFVPKHSASQELITAIREAMLGRTYVTPMIAADLIGTLQRGVPQNACIYSNLESQVLWVCRRSRCRGQRFMAPPPDLCH